MVGIQHDRALESLGALHHVAQPVVVDPAEVLLLRLGIGRRGGGRLPWRQLDSDLLCDRLGDVPLQRQHVGEIALEAVRPNVLIGTRPDELRRDPHALAFPNHRAFHHQIDVQLAPDLRDRLLTSAVSEGRGPRRDAKVRTPREVRDHEVGHGVGEIRLRRILGKAGER